MVQLICTAGSGCAGLTALECNHSNCAVEPGQADMEGQLLPMQQTSPLLAAGGSKGTTRVDTFWAPAAPQELPALTVQSQAALGTLAQDFLSGFTPLAFPYP